MSEHRAVRTSTDVTSGALEAATAALGGSGPATSGRSDRRRNPPRIAYYLGRPAAIYMRAAGIQGFSHRSF
jgi:hypothetical protein